MDRTRGKKMKKLLVLLLAMLMLVSLVACDTASNQEDGNVNTEVSSIPAAESDNEEFNEFLLELYRDYVGSDSLSLHFSLENPKEYGIELEEVTLGSINQEEFDRYNAELVEVISQLETFDLATLSVEQQEDYAMVSDYLSFQESFIGYEYYQYIFTPSSSLTSNMTINFTEFDLRTEADIEKYLTLLADVPRYFDDALAYTQQQVDLGLGVSDGALEQTIEGISTFAQKTQDNELILSFNTKLEAFDLSDEQKQDYINRNQELVLDTIIPAYEGVAKKLETWIGTRTVEGGYESLEGGKEYFEMMVKSELGYEGTIDELFATGEEALKDLNGTMSFLLMSGGEELFDQYLNSSDYFEDATPEEILEEYRILMAEKYPEGPEVSYTATYLDPSIANPSTVAYYLIPPIDNISENVIKINPDNTTDLGTLYTTLAHEGFPGHLFQNTYYFNLNPHPVRTAYDYLGYSEGWAMKVEVDALGWVLEDYPELAMFMASEVQFLYLIQSMTDIGVNYYGWDKEELKEFLSTYGAMYGLEQDTVVDEIYDSAINDPGVLIPYGFGMLTMVDMESQTMEILGDAFDPIEYNRIILETGPVTFEDLQANVDAYIASKQ